MILTHYLAALFGIYMIVMGAFYLVRPLRIKEAAKEIARSSALRLILASFGLFGGLAILLAHKVFTLGAGGLVTLLGILMVIRGGAELFFPEHVAKFNKNLLEEPRFKVLSFIVLGFGILLTILAFSPYIY